MQTMMLTDKHIQEIAEWLDCGMVCFFHKPTGEIEHYPDVEDEFLLEDEFLEQTIDKIENDWSNYMKFEKMNSSQGYRVMEDFAYNLPDEDFKKEVLNRLSNRRPFQNFKVLVESSKYRQDWFDFKKEAYIEWVKEQIE